jgi:beta-phosphoglucomutase
VIKGFFFDLDGTLVETHAANYHAYKQALADFGIELAFEDFKATIGQQAHDFLPKLAPNLSTDEIKQVSDHKAKYYKKLMHVSTANEGLITFMRQMRKNHKIVLVTTARRRNLEAVLEHHSLTEDFDYIIAAEDVKHSKPDPEAYLLALEKTGLTAEEVITFEDSETGAKAAKAAGIAVVPINDFAL